MTTTGGFLRRPKIYIVYKSWHVASYISFFNLNGTTSGPPLPEWAVKEKLTIAFRNASQKM